MGGVSVNREEQIEEYNKCLDEHNLYKKENQQAYDQALVIFLTSTFGFSFLAVAYIGETWETLSYTLLLKIGWIILSATIALFLINFWVGDIALNRELKRKQQLYKIEDTKESIWTKFIRSFNFLVGLAFIVAIGLIVYFVLLNL